MPRLFKNAPHKTMVLDGPESSPGSFSDEKLINAPPIE